MDTEGDEAKAAAGMEQLLAQDPGHQHRLHRQRARGFGAADALEAAGKSQDDVILVSVDGGCDAIKDGVRPGEIDATSQQYPENMASEGVEALAAAARGGAKPSGYLDTGVELITATRSTAWTPRTRRSACGTAGVAGRRLTRTPRRP